MWSLMLIPTLIYITIPNVTCDRIEAARTLMGADSVVVHAGKEMEEEMYSHWIEQAASTLIAAVANKKLSHLPSEIAEQHGECTKKALNLHEHSRCVSQLLQKHKSITRWKQLSKKSYRRPKIRIRREIKITSRTSYSLHDSSEKNPLSKIVQSIMGKGRRNVTESRWKSLLMEIDNDSEAGRTMDMMQTIVSNRMPRFSPRPNRTRTDPSKAMVVDLMNKGVNLTLSILNKRRDGSNKVRLASPRFFPLTRMENEKPEDHVLSPSIFPLYSKEQSDDITLPKILGLSKRDNNMITDFIVEVTGLEDAIEKIVKTPPLSDMYITNSTGARVSVNETQMTDIYGPEVVPKIRTMNKLHETYTTKQLHEFNKTGYAVMTPEQRRTFYGKDSPFRNDEVARGRETTRDIHKAIEQSIHQLASTRHRRTKRDAILSPSIGGGLIQTPLVGFSVVLSPVLFFPIVLSPVIFGPVILSPWLFVPLILSPRAFSPSVLSPSILSPIILNPLIFNPSILSPGVLGSIILSPFLGCPLVLSPMVLTPIILSPYALSPSIFTPTLMSPMILSPFVLSPSVHSRPTALSLILSPFALSPPIDSDPIGPVTVIASPSLLS